MSVVTDNVKPNSTSIQDGRHAEPNGEISIVTHTIRRLVAPLSKEQLIELVTNAAKESPKVLEAAKLMASVSPASRRIMVRNIGFSTKDSNFIDLFKSFGELDDAAIVRDKDGLSRGYGFVTCKLASSVDRILQSRLTLDNRNLLIKLAGDPFADFISGSHELNGDKGSRRKLFVRNLADNTDSQALRSIFEPYGKLDECVVMTNIGGDSRGYGFVTFASAEAAIKAVQEPQRIINSRVAFVSFATPSRRDAKTSRPSNKKTNLIPQTPNMPHMYNPYSPRTYPSVIPTFFTGGMQQMESPHVNVPLNYSDFIDGSTYNQLYV